LQKPYQNREFRPRDRELTVPVRDLPSLDGQFDCVEAKEEWGRMDYQALPRHLFA